MHDALMNPAVRQECLFAESLRAEPSLLKRRQSLFSQGIIKIKGN